MGRQAGRFFLLCALCAFGRRAGHRLWPMGARRPSSVRFWRCCAHSEKRSSVPCRHVGFRDGTRRIYRGIFDWPRRTRHWLFPRLRGHGGVFRRRFALAMAASWRVPLARRRLHANYRHDGRRKLHRFAAWNGCAAYAGDIWRNRLRRF